MTITIGLCFGTLLFAGVPIAVILGISTLVSLIFFTQTPLYIISQQLFTAPDNFVLLAIPFFILAGAIMTRGGIARKLINFVNALVGWFPGGLGMAGILACIFFAVISGSSTATVVAIGSIMIPALKEAAVLSACLLFILSWAMMFFWLLTTQQIPHHLSDLIIMKGQILISRKKTKGPPFFGGLDTIDHKWLMKFIQHRIADPLISALIRKWMRAGVSEDGESRTFHRRLSKC